MIEFRKYEPVCVKTKRPVVCQQYRIFLNNRPVGFLPWRNGSKPLLTERLDPITVEEIEAAAAEVPIPGGGTREVDKAAMPSEVVEIEEEEATADDFE